MKFDNVRLSFYHGKKRIASVTKVNKGINNLDITISMWGKTSEKDFYDLLAGMEAPAALEEVREAGCNCKGYISSVEKKEIIDKLQEQISLIEKDFIIDDEENQQLKWKIRQIKWKLITELTLKLADIMVLGEDPFVAG